MGGVRIEEIRMNIEYTAESKWMAERIKKLEDDLYAMTERARINGLRGFEALDELDKLRLEKKEWGDEFCAVFMMKERVRVLEAENMRLRNSLQDFAKHCANSGWHHLAEEIMQHSYPLTEKLAARFQAAETLLNNIYERRLEMNLTT